MSILFCKQKTAYEMRISDWISDVCSSNLGMRCIAFGPVQSENAASLCIIDQHRTCDGESGAMSTTTFNLRYRPVRIGWCIEPGDFEGFRKAVRSNFTLWGGRDRKSTRLNSSH